MIFSILVIIAILIIGFFHYTQGFVSATISAVLAIVAALMAVAFHEPLVNMLLAGRFADQAHGLALVALFGGIYLGLRAAYDKLVPGNILLPAVLDKVGGAAMGVVAAIFAVGVIAVAAQALPFGPSIAGYTRHETVPTQSVIIPPLAGRRAVDSHVIHELRGDRFEDAPVTPLLVPVDDVLIYMASRLSDAGSLSGRQSLVSVHPDYLQQLFGQRLGIQVGANRTAINSGARRDVEVTGVYRMESVPAGDAEFGSVRQRPLAFLPEGEGVVTFRPREDQVLLVVRAMIDINAGDHDGIFRFSPASVRLVVPPRNGSAARNYHPIGTLENAGFLYANKIDDFLFLNVRQEAGVDFVFAVDRADAAAAANGAAPGTALPREVVLEVKRLARLDLSGRNIETTIPADERIRVMRKPQVVEQYRETNRLAEPPGFEAPRRW